LHALHDRALLLIENVLKGHSWHKRSDVLEGAAWACVPAEHCLTFEQNDSPGLDWNWPSGQRRQSDEPVPTGKYFPAGQTSTVLTVAVVGVLAVTVTVGAGMAWSTYTC